MKKASFFALLLITNLIFAQSKFELSVGLGWPEMTNLKIKYGKVLQIGVCQSFMPNFKKIIIPLTTAEIYYHFGGKSEFTEQPPWYILGGLGCLWSSDGNNFWFYPRVGRSFDFSNRTGINFDIGAFIPLNKDARDFFDSPVYPSGSISFFFRL